jgi:TetR/AcrR family transcriptional regulator, transcriptional repressor for nem operon
MGTIDPIARPRSFDEERVLRDLRDQFWNSGYAGTSLQDLMRVSGLGKGSLYAAYGDKHQLFLRTLRGYVDESHGYLKDAINTDKPAIDILRAIIAAPAGPGAPRGCLMANSTCELASADPDVLAEARRTYDTTTALIAECVTRAQREGDLAADRDAVDLARAILAAQQGLVFMGRTGMALDTLEATAHSLADGILGRNS